MSEETKDVQVILEDEKAILLDHEADGIKELDNQLPRWWVWLFYITIIFSAIYMVYYHVANADDGRDGYDVASCTTFGTALHRHRRAAGLCRSHRKEARSAHTKGALLTAP